MQNKLSRQQRTWCLTLKAPATFFKPDACSVSCNFSAVIVNFNWNSFCLALVRSPLTVDFNFNYYVSSLSAYLYLKSTWLSFPAQRSTTLIYQTSNRNKGTDTVNDWMVSWTGCVLCVRTIYGWLHCWILDPKFRILKFSRSWNVTEGEKLNSWWGIMRMGCVLTMTKWTPKSDTPHSNHLSGQIMREMNELSSQLLKQQNLSLSPTFSNTNSNTQQWTK